MEEIRYQELNQEPQNKKTKKKLSKSALVLIIGLCIIAVPCLIFGGILLKSALQTGSPRNGDRFTNDLEPKITKTEIGEIEESLKSMSGVEAVEINLSEGQVRIYLDLTDSTSSSSIDEILTKAYTTVNNKLPVTTYFTSNESKRMYDLQINAYTSIEESSTREYKVLYKNGAQEQYLIQDVAHAKDPKLAAELEGLAPETTDEINEDISDVDDSEQ